MIRLNAVIGLQAAASSKILLSDELKAQLHRRGQQTGRGVSDSRQDDLSQVRQRQAVG
jgi:hypothetical protein